MATPTPAKRQRLGPSAAPPMMSSILDNIGNTPLVRLNRIPQSMGVKCEVLVKCEFFNAGGSVKDRIGRQMVEDAEKSGRIKPGDVLIEPTSGNTGIGLALAAAVKGYRCVITLPEKMSQEKVDVLKALGAEIIRTPTEAAWDSPESHIGVANRMKGEIPNSHILDQYSNPSNPDAHYNGTAEEILQQCEGKLDMFVASAGTGGTIVGTAKKLKEKLPDVKVVGVDPVGSILAQPEHLNDKNRLQSYKVEGIGYDFIPQVLDRSVVDSWVKTADEESFVMSRRLIREEGLLCGGSCGAAVAGAMRACKDLPAGKRVVVILADSTRNYMTKFLNDQWMVDNGFAKPQTLPCDAEWWSSRCVGDLDLGSPYTISPNTTVQEAVALMTDKGFDQLPVVNENNEIMGVVTAGNLEAKVLSKRLLPETLVSQTLFKQFHQTGFSTKLSDLARIFEKDHFTVVSQTQKCFIDGKTHDRTVVCGVATHIDLLQYIWKNNKPANAGNGADKNSELFPAL